MIISLNDFVGVVMLILQRNLFSTMENLKRNKKSLVKGVMNLTLKL